MTKVHYFSLIMMLSTAKVCAQGGGPPMITDDPGTPDVNSWEINLSFNSDIRKLEKEYELPLLDINYGFNERTQLKVEIPYILTNAANTSAESQFGDLKLGIKYRFFDEGSCPVAFSFYPQVEIDLSGDGRTSYFLPIQLEKHLGKLVLGADMGYVYNPENPDYFFNGLLLGFDFSEHFEMMTELNFLIPREYPGDIDATMNLGMRLELSGHFVFISSIGTGIVSSSGDARPKFISFVGLQLNI